MTGEAQTPSAELLRQYSLAGGYASDVADIANQRGQTKEAIAVLAHWLTNLESLWPGDETPDRHLTRLSLIRALGNRKARGTAAVPALISQFDTGREANSLILWTAGNSLYDIPADDSYFGDMAKIAGNRELGGDRQMVVNWFGKSQKPEAATVVLSQLDDESVLGHALDALSKLRAQGVRDQVEPFLRSKNKWHRRSAERILRYLND
ncbi:HEAT repeat domain-containing protein [Nocardia sp. NPDC050710]|uniref:HEAT repeat domain-containing protein n=1 Tax=Nocardia sp. NPDC050710 TaxID=3157220 RepID=UPI0033EDBBC0